MREFNIVEPYTNKEINYLKNKIRFFKIFFLLFLFSNLTISAYFNSVFILNIGFTFILFFSILGLIIKDLTYGISKYDNYYHLVEMASDNNNVAIYLNKIKNIRDLLSFEVIFLMEYAEKEKQYSSKMIYKQKDLSIKQ